MSSSQTKTIELNGKIYDAYTGKVISVIQPILTRSTTSSNTKSLKHPSSNQVIDSFIKPKGYKNPLPNTPKSKSSIEQITTQKTSTKINHNHPQLAKSQILMRPAVKKPVISVSRVKKVAKRPELQQKSSYPSSSRIAKANKIDKSPLVSRFGQVSVKSSLVKKIEELPIIQAPAQIINHNVSKTASTELAKFEEAIKNANSHLEMLEKNAIRKVPFLSRVGLKNRFANLSAITASALLILGFFAYQNTAYLSLQMASSKSGVAAKMPGYTPSGFGAQKNINFGNGQVTITFKSHSDERNYTISQSTSNWNSTSLLANYVAKSNCDNCYQTWPENGKTIYTFNNNGATWVDGGIWYKIDGNASLTNDQLLRIASSL